MTKDIFEILDNAYSQIKSKKINYSKLNFFKRSQLLCLRAKIEHNQYIHKNEVILDS